MPDGASAWGKRYAHSKNLNCEETVVSHKKWANFQISHRNDRVRVLLLDVVLEDDLVREPNPALARILPGEHAGAATHLGFASPPAQKFTNLFKSSTDFLFPHLYTGVFSKENLGLSRTLHLYFHSESSSFPFFASCSCCGLPPCFFRFFDPYLSCLVAAASFAMQCKSPNCGGGPFFPPPLFSPHTLSSRLPFQ